MCYLPAVCAVPVSLCRAQGCCCPTDLYCIQPWTDAAGPFSTCMPIGCLGCYEAFPSCMLPSAHHCNRCQSS
jgi:hypothetical protein